MSDDTATDDTTPAEKTPAEILTCAANEIETRGLGKHELVNEDGQYCTLGAIALCATGDPFNPSWRYTGNPAYAAKEAVLFYIHRDSIGEWNDTYSRTTEEVVTTLRAVAANLTKKGN